MSESFSFVLVGSGNIASTYVNAVSNLDDIEISAVVSRSGKKPGPLAETDIEIADDLASVESDFDAVILATPNGMHHVDAVKAAFLKKHVLTEKVLDITREAMDDMINACRTAGCRLGVCYQNRTYPDNRAMKELLDKGQLGKVYAADLYAKYYRGQEYYDSAEYRGKMELDGGGPFIQQAAHMIDLYCWFFGFPEKVTSICGTLARDIEVEDHGVAALRHSNGMIGSITASTVAPPGFPPRLEIHSEKGTVIMENNIITRWEIEGLDNPSTSRGSELHSAATSASVSETSGHEAIIADFVRAVREDRDPMVSGESGRMATDLILDIYAAAV